MDMDILLCQKTPTQGKPESNANTILSVLADMDEDMAIFPEMFLTGYGSRFDAKSVCESIDRICSQSEKTGKAVVLGAPHVIENDIFNGLLMVTPEHTFWYDKMHLANFGIYSEESFTPGSKPVMGSFMGMKFGLSICYDIFFPELFRDYSVKGADVNICIAASAIPSKQYFDVVLPARALENVNYLVFVNNVGNVGGLEMHGCSRALDPLGTVISSCDDVESYRSIHVDKHTVKECRGLRHNLDDFRKDIRWFADL